MNENRKSWLVIVGFIIFLFWLIFATAYVTQARQMQPDVKRIREIQAALIVHGYEPGKSWRETQELLRKIARLHHWQTHRAPDARVLILLGLGNKYSNSNVVLEEHNRLDGGTDEE